MKTLIVFFITCRKHLHNIEKIRKYLKQSKIIIISDVEFLIDNKLIFATNLLDDCLPNTICMFMAYPTLERLLLQEYCLVNDIPCVAIEEVNQLSLNNGRINHYFTPLDAIAVPSEVEKQKLINQHIYCKNLINTRWGFYDRLVKKAKIEKQKKILLFLSPHFKDDSVSNETDKMRILILKIVKKLIEQTGYKLSIKLHPIEKNDLGVKKLLKKVNIKAKLISNFSNTSELIASYDLILNRGNSQTIFEALFIGKNIGIINVEENMFPSIFNIENNKQSIEKFLKNLDTEEYFEAKYKLINKHIGSVENSLKKISNILLNSKKFYRNKNKFALHLSLLFFLLNDNNKAYELLPFLKNTVNILIRKFYDDTCKKNLQNALSVFNDDILAQRFLTKIYLDRHFKFFTNKLYVPPNNEIPFFWQQSFKNRLKKTIKRRLTTFGLIKKWKFIK
ncbi:MAG TPA: hypothetical protein QF753_17165 [Victivallales bacterium]|nr:hypothetical protein [Victivallales bacterium]